MAIVAQDQVTLQTISGFKGTVTYYLLQSSALNPPSKPSTETPTGGWTTTEPAFSFDTTLTLYTVPKNLFGVNQFEYGAVQKSSQYEAAKAAYNKAVSTDNSASKTVTAEYAQVTSSTVAPTSGWVGTQPMARAGYFTWLRFKFVTGNGTISYSTPTNISVPQLYSITPYFMRADNKPPITSNYGLLASTTVPNGTLVRMLRPSPDLYSYANAIFIQTIIARGPAGTRIASATNETGTGANREGIETGTDYWLTPTVFTGDWQLFVKRIVCGSTGTFLTTGRITANATEADAANISDANPFNIEIAYSQSWDVTSGYVSGVTPPNTLEYWLDRVNAVGVPKGPNPTFENASPLGYYEYGNGATGTLTRIPLTTKPSDEVKSQLPWAPEAYPKLPTGNLNGAGRNFWFNSAADGPSYYSNHQAVFPLQTGVENGVRWYTGYHTSDPNILYINTYASMYSETSISSRVAPAFYPVSGNITWSADVKCAAPIRARLGWEGEYTNVPAGEWVRLQKTSVNATGETRPVTLDVENTGVPSSTRVYMRNWKLEKGSVATAWTPAPEDDVAYWQKTQSDWKEGTTLYGTNLIEFNDGTFQYTSVTQISSEQAASDAIYISNLAKELAEGLVDLSPSMPENPLPGQVWVSQDEKTNMTGVWRFNGSEWQQSSILTGLIMVPGEDGQMTLVGPKGVDAPSVLADIIRTEVLYANVGGVKKFIVSDIPRENLEDGVKTALDTAESIGTRIVLDGAKGELIIARDKYRSGVSDTMTVLTASSMNFMFDGKAVTSINSETQQLTTVNAQVQGALRFPSHTIKTLPGTSILVFQQA